MKKIVTVIGARPQFIKSKPLSDILRSHRHLKEVIIHTGQHYDFKMYRIFFKELKLRKPDYFLGVSGYDNLTQVALMIKKLGGVLEKENPDLVVVYGDTNSTLAGALAAQQAGVALAHIEAGLRSFRMDMAEEINRVIADRISELLFAPVKEAVSNLKKEGTKKGVYLVGDVLYDVLLASTKYIDKEFARLKNIFHIDKGNYCFLTLHRAEVVDNRVSLRRLLHALNKLAYKIIFPVHPRTMKRIKEFKLSNYVTNISCIAPQSYIRTLAFIKNANAVLTDSGGIQRESYILKTPCITLRDETEWNQTLKSGWNRLVKIDKESLEKLPQILQALTKPRNYEYIFGDGKAHLKILKVIENFLLK